jgi:hypothetical protein
VPFDEFRRGSDALAGESGDLFDEVGRGPGAPLWESGSDGLTGSDTPGSGGRGRLREPFDDLGGAGPDPWDTGVDDAGGRRRPWNEPEPEPYGRRPDAEPAAYRGDIGGRRRLREPDPPAPARDGSPTAPWLFGPGDLPVEPDEPAADAYRRDEPGDRSPGTGYLGGDTGGPDSGSGSALDGYGEPAGGDRHPGDEMDDGMPPTDRLPTLLGDLGPSRPRGRHRRSS